jgi:hypothetical protein
MKDVLDYCYAIGSQLLNGMKSHLMGFIREGLSPTQIMTHDKAHVKEMALTNELVI